ncbi:MAG: alpha amylase C-terminal domain-containing protein [Bacteroidia bacterium]|nr:alpha amylase C-terminal domain-containing protein [Bacteroidia bacterium]
MAESISRIALVRDDPWLEPYEQDILDRLARCMDSISDITNSSGSLRAFAKGHDFFGFHYDSKKKGWWYREWAPGAEALFLIGDFNDWNRESHPLTRIDHGNWEIFLPGADALQHEQRVKVRVVGSGKDQDRIPAYIRRAIQDPVTYDFSGQIWQPKQSFSWSDKGFSLNSMDAPVIYECHTGMAQEKEGVGTYREFADNILPRIHYLGYNTIQMMAVQEHPYYGSFGYHVSNFFAPTSRFGTPEDLKYLINKAHGMGIAVVMDVVHSHAVKNLSEGLNEFDGTEDQYFHPGGRGEHPGWDSKLFNYGKREVQQFLLSNLSYWLEEFHFDGFRFDGVTSMLYHHHGDVSFDHYDRYFKEGVEWDAITYLQMANELIHQIRPDGLSIAEDMSGMPGACRKVEDGGLGFDYRLGMGIPDYWIKLLKHKQDEEWNIHEMWGTLTNRRWLEKTISYAESHDQALVGDKTLAFWLMDKEMYWHMSADDTNPVIDRGMALHKMIRLFTAVLGGEGYLTFMGNEFGHPEWIDFPREGNGWSYKYARRQWSLVDKPELKYHYLNDFDKAMVELITEKNILGALPAVQLNMDTNNQVMIFERNNLIFAFNFHVSNAIADYGFVVPMAGSYRILLDSDATQFGGHGRIDDSVAHHTMVDTHGNAKLSVYLTNRTVLVLERIES